MMEFNLSEKAVEIFINEDVTEKFYSEEDVKESIERLKEENLIHFQGRINLEEMNNIITKLLGGNFK